MRVGIVNTNNNMHRRNPVKSDLTFTSYMSKAQVEAQYEINKILKDVVKGKTSIHKAIMPLTKLLWKVNKNVKNPQKIARDMSMKIKRSKRLQRKL